MSRALVVAVFLLVSSVAAITQQPGRTSADGTEYHRMAMQYSAGATTVSASAPFAFRLATPWLASRLDGFATAIMPATLERQIEDANGLKGFPGFYVVNVAASFLAVMLLYSYLGLFIRRGWLQVLLSTLWIVQWHAPVRFVFFYPNYVDPLFMALLFGGLLAVECSQAGRLGRDALIVSGIAALCTLCRETAVLIPLVFAAKHFRLLLQRSCARNSLLLLAPLASWAVVVRLTHLAAVATGPYDTLGFSIAMVAEKPLHTWVLAWFFTFGPVPLALIASAAEDLWAFCKARNDLAFYVVACAAMAYFGGTDTERILIWASPVVLVALGRAVRVNEISLRKSPLLIVALAGITLVSARLFWPVPTGVDDVTPTASLDFNWSGVIGIMDKLFVINNYYSNLWSFYGSHAIHLFQLAFDLCLAVTLAVYLRRRRTAPLSALP